MRFQPIQENKSCQACFKDYKDDLYTFEDDSEDNLYPWKTTSIDENCANKTKSPIITGKEDTEQQEFSVP